MKTITIKDLEPRMIVNFALIDGETMDHVKIVGVGEELIMTYHKMDNVGVEISDIKEITLVTPASEAPEEDDEPSPKTETKRTSSPVEGKTKKQIALELKEKMPDATRAEAITAMIEEAGMTKAGASTYYHSIWGRKSH